MSYSGITKNNAMRLLQLYSSCYPCKGVCQSVIVDFRREKFFVIPNDLYCFLVAIEGCDYDLHIKKYCCEDQITINEYVVFLLQNKLVFWTTKKDAKRFCKLAVDFQLPAIVSNAIVEVSENLGLFKKVVDSIGNLGCRYIQLRFVDERDSAYLDSIFDIIRQSKLISVEVVFYQRINDDELKCLISNKIASIVVADCRNKLGGDEVIVNKGFACPVFYVKKESLNTCGYISPHYFAVNLMHFSEAVNYNSCLCRKLFVDKTGEIKNCPEMSFSYGNITFVSLVDIVNSEDYRKLWFVKKNEIDVCSVCEFRFICTDCRAFIKDSENIYSQPSKCTYNPYIAKWAGEDGYVPVEECGSYSREAGFVVDSVKVDALNQRVMA